MCTFLSAYVDSSGKVYVGDFASHKSAEETNGLSAALKSANPPVPFEWTAEDSGVSLSVRVPPAHEHNAAFFCALLLAEYPARLILVTALLARKNFPGSLYMRGCTGLTTLPDGLSVGESLYMSGCTNDLIADARAKKYKVVA